MTTLVLIALSNALTALGHLSFKLSSITANALETRYPTISNPKLKKLAQHTLYGED